MSAQSLPLLTLTVTASAVLTRFRAVTAAGAHAAADIFGVTKTDAAVGNLVQVDVAGTTTMESGAAIPAGTKYVVPDAQGRAIPGGAAAANAVLGKLLPGQSASGAGELIEVFLTPTI
ncbi:MAG: hypothetical protein GAK35_03390 [Herbaspirillum frisingense]|uniref:DUF2190 family protein n=1 Tax=Herbaspirillum frisingense TaxID=92645 RepID=A0A7V8FUF4_9BURK|nr:MAG: hypothetical protein GAK35_03390 [Herbaspirillum frisingense]